MFFHFIDLVLGVMCNKLPINYPYSIKMLFMSDSWLLGFCVALRPLVVVSSECSRLNWLDGVFVLISFSHGCCFCATVLDC